MEEEIILSLVFKELLKVPNVFCVALRRPHNRTDKRPDPKYEKGSFGSTGCHSDNLLSDAGLRQSRIQKGDRLVFVQGNRVVFVTPLIIQIDRTNGYNVAIWYSHWKLKEKRPLKLKHSMKLDLDHARMINPNIEDLKKISSHLRKFSQPISNPDRFVKDYEDFVQEQKAKFGDEIYAEHYCQTFCEDDRCEGCIRLIEAEFRESNFNS
jgi:hypothetical protein